MFSKWKYVYEVYKEKSFTNAAKNLYISQPSLSAAIKNIEKKIGAPLFGRMGRSVELTEIGREYVIAAEQFLKVENEFEEKLGDIFNLESGSFTVGGSNYLSSYILPGIITKFRALHPKISIQLKEAKSCSLNKMLLDGEIDMIVDSLDDDVSELTKHALCKEKIFLCVPGGYTINKGFEAYQIQPEQLRKADFDIDVIKPLSITAFKDVPYILLKEENDMYIRASKIFAKRNITPEVVFSVDQLNISYALADSGVGACFITDTFFKYAHQRENVVLYRIEEETKGRTLYTAHKNNKYCTKAMREFIHIAKDIFQKAF